MFLIRVTTRPMTALLRASVHVCSRHAVRLMIAALFFHRFSTLLVVAAIVLSSSVCSHHRVYAPTSNRFDIITMIRFMTARFLASSTASVRHASQLDAIVWFLHRATTLYALTAIIRCSAVCAVHLDRLADRVVFLIRVTTRPMTALLRASLTACSLHAARLMIAALFRIRLTAFASTSR